MATLRLMIKIVESRQVAEDAWEPMIFYRSADVECPKSIFKALDTGAVVIGAELIKET